MNRSISIIIVLACSFIGFSCYSAEPATKPAKVTMKEIPVTPKKNFGDFKNQTVYGKRLMYNGNGTYTLFVRGEGKEVWPFHVGCEEIVVLEDAAPDAPISVDVGEFSRLKGWFRITTIHIHDVSEINAGAWVHTSGGKYQTHTPYKVQLVE